jgi:hypothetical protein
LKRGEAHPATTQRFFNRIISAKQASNPIEKDSMNSANFRLGLRRPIPATGSESGSNNAMKLNKVAL